MRKSCYSLAILTFLLVGLAITGVGCAKKVAPPPPVVTPEPPPPPPPPPPPAPVITLSASPTAITRGQSSTLSWNASNATTVVIDGGIGSVGSSGSRTVSPSASTTYTGTATGPGGSRTGNARITVTEPPPVAPPPPPPPPRITDEEFFATRVKDVFFDFDKYNIRDDARLTLNDNARSLAERSGIRFLIEGHCDERGSNKYNLALGDRRANAAKEHLVTQGISSDRVETISYGEERPFDPGHNEEAWAKNRRAHFKIK